MMRRTAHFTDGSTTAVDAVIWATGCGWQNLAEQPTSAPNGAGPVDVTPTGPDVSFGRCSAYR